MKADFFYENACGRVLLNGIQKLGMFRMAAWFMHRSASKLMIPGFIRENGIDMTEFEGQTYRSFAEFFARRKEITLPKTGEGVLISPCDGLLSVVPVSAKMDLPLKGSHYSLTDLIPKKKAKRYAGGLCLIFRLEATDYHHFCCIDDAEITETHYVPGLLHSVQPIAIRSVPVYRLNRRWWSLLTTRQFGTVAQIEVGAMVVGGVTFVKKHGYLAKGEEMGNFELAGSTIILLLDAENGKKLSFFEKFQPAAKGFCEIPVRMAEGIGSI